MVKLLHTSWIDEEEYVHWDEEKEVFIIDDDAPDWIKEEYRLYWEQVDRIQKKERETGYRII